MADTKIQDLHLLPKFRDRWSYIYIEHAIIDKKDNAIAYHDKEGVTQIPVASLATLMLGPGTSITQSAIDILADNNCLVIWCGEESVRFYACGTGGTRSASRLLRQARLACNEQTRLQVVRRMYAMRFVENVDDSITVEQLRGMEGARVRQTYAKASEETGCNWNGRNYNRMSWESSDKVNRALSTANSCLYGLCHAAILSAGYSPALGFIHTGKQLSFVYDIADLYKVDLTIPIAFKLAADPPEDMDFGRAVRLTCRDEFKEKKLLSRIIPDIAFALGESDEVDEPNLFDEDPALPAELWTPESENKELRE